MSRKKSEDSPVDDSELVLRTKHAIITKLHPNMSDGPRTVNNIKGQTFGNISASGNFSAPKGTIVQVIAVSGGAIPVESIPAIPMPGSVSTKTLDGGDWSHNSVPSALCSCTGSPPQNQVIAWGLNSDGTYSIASANFTGKCINCPKRTQVRTSAKQQET